MITFPDSYFPTVCAVIGLLAVFSAIREVLRTIKRRIEK